MKPINEARWWREHFPSTSARDAADAAIDALPIELPMSAYIDAWVRAYLAAGGKTPLAEPPPPTTA